MGRKIKSFKKREPINVYECKDCYHEFENFATHDKCPYCGSDNIEQEEE